MALEVREEWDLHEHAQVYDVSGDAPRFVADLGKMNKSPVHGLRTMSLSADGTLLAVIGGETEDTTIYSLAADPPIPVNTIESDFDSTVQFLADSTFLALERCKPNCEAWIYDAQDKSSSEPLRRVPLGSTGTGRFFSQGRWFVTSEPANTTVYDISFGERGPVFTEVCALEAIYGDVSFSPDGRYIAVGHAGVTHLVELKQNGKKPKLVAELPDWQFDLRFSPDGRYYAVSRAVAGNPIYLHDVSQQGDIAAVVPGALIRRVPETQAIAFSGDGRYMAAASGGSLRLYAPPSSVQLPDLSVALRRGKGRSLQSVKELCLDVKDGAVDGAQLWFHNCSATRAATQRWTLQSDRMLLGDGSSGLCVDLGDAAAVWDGSPGYVRACDGSASQQIGYRTAYAEVGFLQGVWCLGPQATPSDPREVAVELVECSNPKLSSDTAIFDMTAVLEISGSSGAVSV